MSRRHTLIRRGRHAAALVAALALALPAGASADDCEAPPGRSGIDQYCESVPGPDRDRGSESSSRVKNERAVPAPVQKRLEDEGDDGAAVAELATAGAPRERKRREQPAKEEGAAGAEPSNNPLAAVTSAVDSGSTAGPGLVWLLIGVALLLSAVAWLRYRRRDPQGPGAS